MHRRSNLQCGELFSDFSVNSFGPQPNCNPLQIPQNMRPYSNRMCNNYDYTKNGIRTMFVNPVCNCRRAMCEEAEKKKKQAQQAAAVQLVKPVLVEVTTTEEPVAVVPVATETAAEATTTTETFAPVQNDVFVVPAIATTTAQVPVTVATRMPSMIVPGAPYVAVPAVQATPLIQTVQTIPATTTPTAYYYPGGNNYIYGDYYYG